MSILIKHDLATELSYILIRSPSCGRTMDGSTLAR